jgi:hypothetical protein
LAVAAFSRDEEYRHDSGLHYDRGEEVMATGNDKALRRHLLNLLKGGRAQAGFNAGWESGFDAGFGAGYGASFDAGCNG